MGVWFAVLFINGARNMRTGKGCVKVTFARSARRTCRCALRACAVVCGAGRCRVTAMAPNMLMRFGRSSADRKYDACSRYSHHNETRVLSHTRMHTRTDLFLFGEFGKGLPQLFQAQFVSLLRLELVDQPGEPNEVYVSMPLFYKAVMSGNSGSIFDSTLTGLVLKFEFATINVDELGQNGNVTGTGSGSTGGDTVRPALVSDNY